MFSFPKLKSFWPCCFITCFNTEKHFLNIFSGHCTFSCTSFRVVHSSDFCPFITPCPQHSDKSHWLSLYQHREKSYMASISSKALNPMGSSYPTTLSSISMIPVWSVFLPWFMFLCSPIPFFKEPHTCLYGTWVVLVVYCPCVWALQGKDICFFSALLSYIWGSTWHTASSCLTLVGWSIAATSG